jgi:hypothetical protein
VALGCLTYSHTRWGDRGRTPGLVAGSYGAPRVQTRSRDLCAQDGCAPARPVATCWVSAATRSARLYVGPQMMAVVAVHSIPRDQPVTEFKGRHTKTRRQMPYVLAYRLVLTM